MKVPGRGIVTLASGDDRFQHWAKYLLMSLRKHDPSVRTAVVTDVPDSPHLAGFDQIVLLDPSRGDAYAQKLWLPEYSPFVETLFLDADCMVYQDLREVWESLEDGPIVGLAARSVTKPKWCKDVSSLPEKYQVKSYLEFNGGLVYWRYDDEVREIFEEARDIFDNHYEEFGLHLFGPRRGDEPALALAMSRRRIPSIHEHRHSMRGLSGLSGQPRLRIAEGIAEFIKHDELVEPAIVHFTGSGTPARALHSHEMMALRLLDLGVPPQWCHLLTPAALAVQRRRAAVQHLVRK